MTDQADLDLLDLAEAVARGDRRDVDAERRSPTSAADVRELASAIRAVRAHAMATQALQAPEPAMAGVGEVRLETAVGGGRIIRRRPSVAHSVGRTGRPTALLVAAAFLVGAAVIGLAVGGGFPAPPRPTPLPAVVVATPSPIVVTAAPTVDAEASASAVPDSPITVGPVLFRDVKVQGIHFTPTGVGWAKGVRTIYRSTDSGVTWTDVHAPFPTAFRAARFIDADTAYIASGSDPTIEPSGKVAVTHDGGATWLTTTVDAGAVADESPVVSITTPDSGTVTFVDRDGRALHVFRTEDGGRTWDGPRLNSVPAGMDGITGGFGPDTGVVWSSNGQADGQPFDDRLAFSIDGWATFRETRFPIDSHAPAGVLKNVVAVRADASGHMLLAIDVDGGSRAIYSSTDFGKSWSFLKDAANHEVDFLSMTDWVLTSEDPTGTWWTTDGGSTWQAVIGGSRVHFDAIGIAIASAEDMWAVHDCDRAAGPFYPGPDPYCDGRSAKQVLLVTHDGGRTWKGVGE